MMKRLLKWIGLGFGGLVALGFVAYVVVYVLSERVLRHVYAVPTVAISIPTDPASIVEGQRLATIRGCFGGCHGKHAQGVVMFDEPMLARVIAPNLTAAVRKYSVAELANIIRNGVRPGGQSMMVMPAAAFVGLTDADLSRIIAFLKSLPELPGPAAGVSIGPLGRIGLASGKFKTEAQLIAETVPPPAAKGEPAVLGRYLARTICAHCHGTGLRGDSNPDFTSPSLQIVAAYSADSFMQLLRTGVPQGGRDLPSMGPWAKNLLSQLNDEEIAALYSYLHTMP
jgi:cytochrome c553